VKRFRGGLVSTEEEEEEEAEEEEEQGFRPVFAEFGDAREVGEDVGGGDHRGARPRKMRERDIERQYIHIYIIYI